MAPSAYKPLGIPLPSNRHRDCSHNFSCIILKELALRLYPVGPTIPPTEFCLAANRVKLQRLVFYSRDYLKLREELRMKFAVWKSSRSPPPEANGIPNVIEFLVFSTMQSIAWSPSRVPKIFRAWLFRTLFGLTVLLYVPVALLWGLRPLSWPRYIPLSLTLGWVLVYNAALVAYRVVDYGPDSPLHHISSSLSVLHLLPTAMFTLSYPALMINVGDIPGTESWSRSVRILPATVVPAVMFVALLGMKAMRLRD